MEKPLPEKRPDDGKEDLRELHRLYALYTEELGKERGRNYPIRGFENFTAWWSELNPKSRRQRRGESRGLLGVLRGRDIVQLFTYPHAPKQNAVWKRFNRTFQEECLLGRRVDLTQSLEIIQAQINAWLVFYNTERPHESLGNLPPVLALFRWKIQHLPENRQHDPFAAICYGAVQWLAFSL